MTEQEELKLMAGMVEEGDCIRWKSEARTANRRRHPLVNIGGKPVLVRRAVYEKEKGPLRPSMFLIPICGDECCIKPDHQKQITRKQKNDIGARNAAKAPGRSAKVAAAVRASGRAKLSVEAARDIRDSDETIRALALRYGVDERAIWAVRNNISWKDYSSPFRGLLG